MSSGRGVVCRQVLLYLLLALLLALGAGFVSAHAPLGVGSDEDIANAPLIPDPAKSYVLHTGLHEGGMAQ